MTPMAERSDTDPLREIDDAAAEIARTAEEIREICVRTTATLTAAARRFPVSSVRVHWSLLRALTNRRGLGYALEGGRLGRPAARLGAMAGRSSLATLVAVTSLRLRIAGVLHQHPELAADPLMRRLLDAVSTDHDIEAVRAVRTLFKEKGTTRAISSIAPIFGEVFAMRALLDENPFNNETGWSAVTGRAFSAEPLLGIPGRAFWRWDSGEGAAVPAELPPEKVARINVEGTLVGLLSNIVIINDGRILLQTVEAADGAVRYVVMAPGMRPGAPQNDSPQDLVGAWKNNLTAESSYTGAIARAVEHMDVPDGAELALVGHSAGGAAVMNLAQDPVFSKRYKITHVIAVGAPLDTKAPADPGTWVASITNQHDLVPALDGQGAGSCFERPGWYVVDYINADHEFPLCHSLEVYIADIEQRLHEAREAIDARLAPYRGRVTRSQSYRVLDRPASDASRRSRWFLLAGSLAGIVAVVALWRRHARRRAPQSVLRPPSRSERRAAHRAARRASHG